MGKMWDGRFQEGSAKLLEEFNASLPFDQELYREDIEGSIAHARMLGEQGILTPDEVEAIEKGLGEILAEIEKGEFQWRLEDEDIHMAIERRLTELIGEPGKKLHTGRSRNDQIALDFRRWVLRQNRLFQRLLIGLIEVLVQLAEEHRETILPGMTHLQHAQPITFGYHLLAYAQMFRRDLLRFQESYNRNNLNPLGCAALAGTPHPIDRFKTTKILGFKAPTPNCLDTVSDRDFALEHLFNIAMLFMHMSRLSEELILWSSQEFQFITIADRYATGSSIMPQKKNPDVPELIRGKTGRAYGNLVALFTTMKGLPLAYNKDLQEDKEVVFDSNRNGLISLKILKEVLATLQVNREQMYRATQTGHITATDLADYLVRKGVPFREAHRITGRAVAEAERRGVDLSQLPLKVLKGLDPKIGDDLDLSVEGAVASRRSYGGTSPAEVARQIEELKKWLSNLPEKGESNYREGGTDGKN
ncbi:MAG: argininosuccinate lyase [Campylobacterales bacterium]